MDTTPEIENIQNLEIFQQSLHNSILPNRKFIELTSFIMSKIYLLSKNCHIAEYTNHSLSHIFSVLKRIEKWATNDNWLCKLTPNDCFYLVLSTLIHDIGMISKFPLEEEINTKRDSMPCLFRETHHLRISPIINELLKDTSKTIDNSFNFSNLVNNKHIILACKIGERHRIWPWENNFEKIDHYSKNANYNSDKAKLLIGILSVADLIDEDSTRCNAKILLKHRYGEISNYAHWIKHSFIENQIKIKNNKIHVTTNLPHYSDTHLNKAFDKVMKFIDNHYNFVKIYNQFFKIINIEIQKITIENKYHLTDNYWENNIVLKYSLPYELMNTFRHETSLFKNKNAEKYLKLCKIRKIEVPNYDDYFQNPLIIFKKLYKNKVCINNILIFTKEYIHTNFYGKNIELIRKIISNLYKNYLSKHNIIKITSFTNIEWYFIYSINYIITPDECVQYKNLLSKIQSTSIKIDEKSSLLFFINFFFDFFNNNITLETIPKIIKEFNSLDLISIYKQYSKELSFLNELVIGTFFYLIWYISFSRNNSHFYNLYNSFTKNINSSKLNDIIKFEINNCFNNQYLKLQITSELQGVKIDNSKYTNSKISKNFNYTKKIFNNKSSKNLENIHKKISSLIYDKYAISNNFTTNLSNFYTLRKTSIKYSISKCNSDFYYTLNILNMFHYIDDLNIYELAKIFNKKDNISLKEILPVHIKSYTFLNINKYFTDYFSLFRNHIKKLFQPKKKKLSRKSYSS